MFHINLVSEHIRFTSIFHPSHQFFSKCPHLPPFIAHASVDTVFYLGTLMIAFAP